MGEILPQGTLHPLIKSHMGASAQQSAHDILVEEKTLGILLREDQRPVPFWGAEIWNSEGPDLPGSPRMALAQPKHERVLYKCKCTGLPALTCLYHLCLEVSIWSTEPS